MTRTIADEIMEACEMKTEAKHTPAPLEKDLRDDLLKAGWAEYSVERFVHAVSSYEDFQERHERDQEVIGELARALEQAQAWLHKSDMRNEYYESGVRLYHDNVIRKAQDPR